MIIKLEELMKYFEKHPGEEYTILTPVKFADDAMQYWSMFINSYWGPIKGRGSMILVTPSEQVKEIEITSTKREEVKPQPWQKRIEEKLDKLLILTK